jgi:hypothetical protein
MTDFFQTQRTLFAHGCGTGIYNCAPGVRPRLRNQVAFCNKKNRPFYHVPLVLEIKITTISKRIRKDSFSQYSKSGKIVFRNIRNPERKFFAIFVLSITLPITNLPISTAKWEVNI